MSKDSKLVQVFVSGVFGLLALITLLDQGELVAGFIAVWVAAIAWFVTPQVASWWNACAPADKQRLGGVLLLIVTLVLFVIIKTKREQDRYIREFNRTHYFDLEQRQWIKR